MRLGASAKWGSKRYWFAAFLFAVFAVIACVGTVSRHHGADLSVETQRHGVHDTITIDSVRHASSRHRSYTSYYSFWTGTLDRPVAGVTTTTTYLHGYSTVPVGSRQAVLVDPQRPSYSEPVGQAYATRAGWVAPLVLAVVFGVLALGMGTRALHLTRRKRREQSGWLPTAS